MNYPTPVMVNGFLCKNCTDVDYAKKHIDPAHPKDGPYGVNAPGKTSAVHAATVSFGGALAGRAQSPSANPSAASLSNGAGQRLNIQI